MRVLGRFTGAVVIAVVLIGLGPAPAWAHGADPTLVALLTEVRPALPPEVLVQVRTGYSEQMLVANPTDTPLTVLDPDGVGFLRVSSAGVFGNITSPYLHATAAPPDSPVQIPPQALGGRGEPTAEPRWVPLSQGDAWGWFERRLHPFVPGEEPTFPQQRAVLASWQVELRYGDLPLTALGVLERRPITGAFRATADPRGDQLSVGVGQGLLPAVQLTVPSGRTVTVQGSDGVPFLRIAPSGVAVNLASVHYADNPQFQGLPAGPDGWLRVGAAPSVTWLDSRLRYHADRPPDGVEAAGAVMELGRWNIPVTIDGQARLLTGAVEWVPTAAAATMVRTDAPGTGFPWATVGLGVGAAALLVALGALLLREVRTGRSCG
ncbi:MAG: hypothetical protein ACRDTC_19730 [Pseudonocardiaceae bacterium]